MRSAEMQPQRLANLRAHLDISAPTRISSRSLRFEVRKLRGDISPGEPKRYFIHGSASVGEGGTPRTSASDPRNSRRRRSLDAGRLHSQFLWLRWGRSWWVASRLARADRRGVWHQAPGRANVSTTCRVRNITSKHGSASFAASDGSTRNQTPARPPRLSEEIWTSGSQATTSIRPIPPTIALSPD
jgi:hypothetical protein